MKKNYQWIVNAIENLLVSLHTLKMKGGEHITLYKNRRLYENVIWSKVQQIEFDRFWNKFYGKKISSKGHRYFESINSVYHKEYFPEFLYTTKLEPKLNNYKYAQVYSDKNLFEVLYAKSRNVKIPETYIVNANNIYYDGDRNVISEEEVFGKLKNIGEVVMKPTIGGSEGRGVEFYNFIDGKDVTKMIDLLQLLSSNFNFIVQESIQQHSSNELLHPSSLNTIRIITYIANNKIYHAPLCLRMGTGLSKVDNLLAGGLLAGIDDDGNLKDFAYRLGDSKERITTHPNTNITFEGYKIEGTRKISKVAKELHGFTPNIGIISWDMILNDKEEVVLIEANFLGQSIRYPQITHGKPIFGDNTEYMMKLISK